MEASSHGIDQRRLDGVRLDAAGFTNLGRDHLDYHATTEAYAAAKLRLFDTLLPGDAPAIVNADGPYADVFLRRRAASRPEASHHRQHGRDACASSKRARRAFGQALTVEAFGTSIRDEPCRFSAPSRSRTRSSPRASCSRSKARAVRGDVLEGLPESQGRVGAAGAGRRGRRRALHRRLRPQARCAGPCARCPASLRARASSSASSAAAATAIAGKRPLMGRIAADKADVVIVTDDNPRSEDPAAIRAEIIAGAPGAREIGDRAEAIRTAVQRASAGRCSGRGRQRP